MLLLMLSGVLNLEPCRRSCGELKSVLTRALSIVNEVCNAVLVLHAHYRLHFCECARMCV